MKSLMMRALMIGAVSTLAACANTVPQQNHPSNPNNQTSAPNDGQPNELPVAFKCDNGQKLSVRFLRAEGLAIMERGEHKIELKQQISGSGFIYSNGPNTIRGKGSHLTGEIGRMMPIECEAQ